MLAPHAVDIAVIISSLIASLCFTFAEPFDDIFLFIKLCIGQRKYKQKKDRPSEWIRACYFAFCILQNSRKKTLVGHVIIPSDIPGHSRFPVWSRANSEWYSWPFEAIVDRRKTTNNVPKQAKAKIGKYRYRSKSEEFVGRSFLLLHSLTH